MTMVFWGFFFILLNFNISLGGIIIPLLPDAVGYILLICFVQRRKYLHPAIGKTRTLWCILAVIGVLEVAMGLTGITFGSLPGLIISVVSWILLLLAGTDLLRGLAKVGSSQGLAQKGKLLCNLWIAVIVLRLVVMVLGGFGLFGTVISLASLIVIVVFLVLLYDFTRRLQG